ncbi:MAG: class I SAM-dependent methyltransferase [Promethearchaeota archaeon]
MNYEEAINTQYGKSDLGDKILAILENKDLDIEGFNKDVLAPIEELHLHGRAATIELAKGVGLNEKMRVLDIGCGIGGPARTLASEFGCHVTGLDLSKEYCTAAKIINDKLGLNNNIEIKQGNALNMPFDNAEFDLVFMQHVLMNIENKEHLITQINRVLGPKGRLAIHTICASSTTPIHLPVIWADNPDINFLLTNRELSHLISDIGFIELYWRDHTKQVLEGIQQARSKRKPVNFDLFSSIVPDVSIKWRNINRNLNEGRIIVMQGIFECN